MAEVDRDNEALLFEERVFEPPEEFRANAIVRDRSPYERVEADHEGFWAEQAERLTWFERWHTVMEWSPPWVAWFAGGPAERLVQLPRSPRDVARGRSLGDVTTLANAEVVEQIHTMVESGAGSEE